MKKSRLTEEQIISILREQVAGVATADVYRKHGISSAKFFRLVGQVRRRGCLRCPQAEGAGKRERQAEETTGRGDTR